MISVLIPVYNTELKYLDECLQSVWYQENIEEYEVVIINNGSTDSALNNYLSNINTGITNVYNCPRQFGKKNLSVALNFGLQRCKYEYIARMDSDDIMLPTRLEKQFSYMQENDVDILGTQLKNMYGDQHQTSHPRYIFPTQYKQSTYFICHPTVMFKKSKIIQIGGYQESPDHIPEDYLLWVNALKAGLQIHNLQEVLVYYRNKGYGLSDIDSIRPEWNDAIRKAILE